MAYGKLCFGGDDCCVCGGVFADRKGRAYFEWANEVLFLAFDNAEKKGLLDGWSGADKLRHYLGIWRQAYLERFGKEPGEEEMQFAINKAAELALRKRVLKQPWRDSQTQNPNPP